MSLLTSTNPGKNYEVVGTIEISSLEDVKAAVEKAKRAQPLWAQASLEERIGFYQKLLQVYEKRAEAIAMIQTREMGKPITSSRADVADDQVRIKRMLEQAKTYLQPEVVDVSATQTNTIFFEPYGVVAAITPWNFPSSNFFIATTQALLAGNTVVFKHSEECPLTSKLLAEVFAEAGFPDGVFTMLYGDGKVGQLLMEQPIDFIHFTGSSKVGEQLYKLAGEKFIPAVLEMGGSSPGVVFADAALDLVAQSACVERFSNCGQICCALKRLIVHRDVYDEVVKRVVAKVAAMQVGDPLEEGTTMGPLVAARQLALLEEQVADAREKGAKVEIGGSHLNFSMSNQNITTHKFVAILNKKIDSGKVLNALAHMSLGLVAGATSEEREQMGFFTYTDADGNEHKDLSKNSYVILRADNGNQIRTAREQAIASGVRFVDFTDSMQDGTYLEQIERIKNIHEAELNYVGICLFGLIEKVSEITKKFGLWR